MSFFSELRRRNVFKVEVAYAVMAWVFIQVVSGVLRVFDVPRWVVQTVALVLVEVRSWLGYDE